jgi:hypothetical protein
MDSTRLYELFRSEIADTAAPYLWADDEVFHYADEAQKKFCRLTGGLADATTPTVARVSLKAGNPWAALSPLILKIRGINGADGRYIDPLNFEDLQERQIRIGDIHAAPTKLILGMEANKVRAYPVPVADEVLELLVYRLPLKAINDFDQKIEIDEHHHTALLLWMKHLAYSKQDAETFDKTRRDEFEQAFYAYCFNATIEKGVAKHKTRFVAYGGL